MVDLPSFEATWRPLRMETVPGSGEEITVAVIVRTAGASQIRQSVAPSLLAAIFGNHAGTGVKGMVAATVIELQQQLDRGVGPDQLEPPYGGFVFGHWRDCVAKDVNEVFTVAIRLSTAFGRAGFRRG